MVWIWLCRQWPHWKGALLISSPRPCFGGTARATVATNPTPAHCVFERISTDHPECGEDRIALEMKIKLGVDHRTSTIRRYMVESGRPPESTWLCFLASHAHEFFTMDFATQVMWDFSTRYILIVMALDTREVVHFAVTGPPTLGWVVQQLRRPLLPAIPAVRSMPGFIAYSAYRGSQSHTAHRTPKLTSNASSGLSVESACTTSSPCRMTIFGVRWRSSSATTMGFVLTKG